MAKWHSGIAAQRLAIALLDPAIPGLTPGTLQNFNDVAYVYQWTDMLNNVDRPHEV